MAKEVDLLSYWMLVLRQLKEFKEIAKTEEPELRYILEACDRTLNNFFISTADEYGISRFEKMLGIYPSSDATLESRRSRVQSKWFANSVPYTMRFLKQRLTELCGDTDFAIDVDTAGYTLTINSNLEAFGKMDELDALINMVVPCNLVTVLQNNITCEAHGTVAFGTGIVTIEFDEKGV